ncbi:PHYH [Mytilus edulis]|uniref:phytanoyl-CoA dioxygenase n=1 Tax=Mytilus edulis TaxID=6550 RepID=A0A8S3R9S9_MYTED|nr:PHYH [Mytilus edulis]
MAARLKTLFGHIQEHKTPTDVSTVLTHASPYTGIYKYTLNSPRLTEKQRQFYEDNGYLVIEKLVPAYSLQKYRERFEQICKKEVVVPGLTIMRDIAISKDEFVPGQKAVTKIQDFQLDEELFEYCKLPEVLDYVEAIVGSNIKAIHTMLINKPPDPGRKTSRQPMHQDLHYFPMKPAEKIVCSWTAMQKLIHDYPEWEGGVNLMYHGVRDYDPSMPRSYLEMEAGDTVFFHPLLIHGSGRNRTKGFRKSISSHYASSDIEFAEQDSQSTISEEVLNLVVKQYKVPREQR